MAQALNLCSPSPIVPVDNSLHHLCGGHLTPKWVTLQRNLKCKGRLTCLFSDNCWQDQARKALEGALGGKKTEFEKWNKEIQKREQSGGGSNSGGIWFGGGGWFGWSNNERFWEEAQQTSIAIWCILVVYLLLAKGQVMLAIVFNSILFALCSVRNGLSFLAASLFGKIYPIESTFYSSSSQEAPTRLSAKDNIVEKWGADS